jgi:hypothetical protein
MEKQQLNGIWKNNNYIEKKVIPGQSDFGLIIRAFGMGGDGTHFEF